MRLDVVMQLCLALQPPTLPAEDPKALGDAGLLARAEAEFRRGVSLRYDRNKAKMHFRLAALCYAELLKRGFANAELYRNLGNAHLLAGELAPAILAYRRGLRLAPNDAALRQNLEYARELVAYPSADVSIRPAPDEWPPWLPRPTKSLLLGMALLFYALACVLATRWWMTRRGSRLFQAIVAALVGLACAGGWGYLLWQDKLEHDYPLVVIATDREPLRRGNGVSYATHPEVPFVSAGTEARRLHERGGWLQIELPGRVVGWVPCAAALVDEE